MACAPVTAELACLEERLRAAAGGERSETLGSAHSASGAVAGRFRCGLFHRTKAFDGMHQGPLLVGVRVVRPRGSGRARTVGAVEHTGSADPLPFPGALFILR